VSLENPLAYLVLMLVILGTSQLLVRGSHFFGQLATVPAGRFGALDGFRGFLASGVFVHHAVVNYGYAQSGVWAKPTGRLYEALGGDCVLYFFMITGLLFWSKCLKGGGHIDAKSLVVSRIKRIMPAYLASAGLLFAAVAIRSQFRVRVPLSVLCAAIGRWLCGGLLGSPDINGVSPVTINGAVTWTLQYEWVFYLLLPVIAIFATHRRFPGLLLIAFALAFATRHLGLGISIGLVARFLVGMSVAHLLVLRPALRAASGPLASAVVLACLVTAAALRVPRPLAALLMCVAFTGIVYGNDVFGLLRTRAAVCLGHVSYSLYLMHCIVLYAAIQGLSATVPLASLSPSQFWIFCLPIAVAVVLVAGLSYRLFEHPFLAARAPNQSAPGAIQGARG
jgi:peptidoglycan/LPS O-acetylase OafA/YrhL